MDPQHWRGVREFHTIGYVSPELSISFTASLGGKVTMPFLGHLRRTHNFQRSAYASRP